MRYLILSDIHANIEALEAVLASAAGAYDRIACCGDLVGYAADPGPVVDWAGQNVPAIVRGNHDKACSGGSEIEWFTPLAQKAARWTMATLTPRQTAYLAGLPQGPISAGDFTLLHGAPLDEDEYILTPGMAVYQAAHLDASVAFFGHTHVQGGFRCHRNGVRPLFRVPEHRTELVVELQRDEISLVNPGSVGQPRDGDPRAAYCLYSPAERVVAYRRVPYDIAAAQRKIREGGLPPPLADRLASGH